MTNRAATSWAFRLISSLVLAACGGDGGGAHQLDGAASDDGGAVEDGSTCLDAVDLEGGDALWPGYCEKHIDEAGDGRVDRVHSYEYDEEHRPVLFVVGEPPTGSQKRWTYDERGNLVLEEYDNGLDDVWEVAVERTYDEHDNLLSEVTDDEGDGVPNRSHRHAYACWPVSEGMAAGPCTTELDLNGDGTADLVQIREYDDQARLLTVTEQRADTAELTRKTTHRYDDAGDRVETEVDVGVDGVLEERLEREYDGDHHLLSTRTDRDADGTIELQHDNTFDEEGALTREEKLENNLLIYRIDYERDARDLVTRETETFFAARDRDNELRRYHDAAGNPVLEVRRRRASEAQDSCVHFEYACFNGP